MERKNKGRSISQNALEIMSKKTGAKEEDLEVELRKLILPSQGKQRS